MVPMSICCAVKGAVVRLQKRSIVLPSAGGENGQCLSIIRLRVIGGPLQQLDVSTTIIHAASACAEPAR